MLSRSHLWDRSKYEAIPFSHHSVRFCCLTHRYFQAVQILEGNLRLKTGQIQIPDPQTPHLGGNENPKSNRILTLSSQCELKHRYSKADSFLYLIKYLKNILWWDVLCIVHPQQTNKNSGKNPTTSQIFAGRLRSVTVHRWAPKKHSARMLDSSRCQSKTPAARSLPAGSNITQTCSAASVGARPGDQAEGTLLQPSLINQITAVFWGTEYQPECLLLLFPVGPGYGTKGI